jgi:hypothetical protein
MERNISPKRTPITRNAISPRSVQERRLTNISGEENEIGSKDEIKECCLNIFLNFAKIKNKDNEFILCYTDLAKILKMINIIHKDCLSQNDIELVLKSVNPLGTSLNCDQFMNFIAQLSYKLQPEEFKASPKQSVTTIVKSYFYPLFNYIQDNKGEYFPTKEIQSKILDVHFDENVIIVLNSVYSGMSYMYKAYFYHENCVNFFADLKSYSMKNIIDFCKDFNIIPFIAAPEKIGIIYHMLSEMGQEEITKTGPIYDESKDIGQFFKISKFVAFLVHIALLSFEKYEKFLTAQGEELGVDVTATFDNCAKLILFLEKLQNSPGFGGIDKKTNKPFSSKMLVLPTRDIIEQVIYIHNTR